MISRSVSGEGESLKAAMIHCALGTTTSRARIAAPISQFMTMRIRSTTCAIGSAADDEAGLDMISLPSDISNINTLFIECRQVGYWKSINEQMSRDGPNGGTAGRPASQGGLHAERTDYRCRYWNSRGLAEYGSSTSQ